MNDYLHIEEFILDSTGAHVTWPSKLNLLYEIERSSDLLNGNWNTVLYMGTTLTTNKTVSDAGALAETNLFYRVKVRP